MLFALTLLLAAADWPEVRGPARDGVSAETGLPDSWSPDGENLAFRLPEGGRSTPVVMGDLLFLQNASGDRETRQEQLLAIDARTGAVRWRQRRNIFHSDAPPRRVGWASPAADRASGLVFSLTVGAGLSAFDAETGARRWERSLPEELGVISTHGGRTPSPLVHGDLVIVSGVSSSWGAHAPGRQRFFAFEAATGALRWMSAPGGRPWDTTYAPASIHSIGGRALLLAGGGDGAFHALDPATGDSVWSYPMSKRGVNSGAVVFGDTAVVSHGEENLNSSTMGLLAALDARSRGEIAEDAALWRAPGFLAGFSTGVSDGETLYWMDNSANLAAFDPKDGTRRWTRNLGTIQRASPVLADGKLYVGAANGRFFILKPEADGVAVLDEDFLGTEAAPEEIVASVAVSDGLVYLVSSAHLYAIGAHRPAPAPPKPTAAEPAAGPAARLLVSPTEEILAPDDEIALQVRAFDDRGRETGVPGALSWETAGFAGAVENGSLRIPGDAPAGAGTLTATAGGLSATARFRVVPPLPWHWDFDAPDAGVPAQWVNAAGKYATRALDSGERVLVKLADNPFLRRARVYMGPPDMSGYSVRADARASERRRQLGNVGLVAQRYQLVLMGNHQRLEIHSWQAAPGRTAQVPFAWSPDAWYSMRFEVVEDGDATLARGRVWPRDEPEPDSWTIEWREALPHTRGAPGVFADAVAAEIHLDNIAVTPLDP